MFACVYNRTILLKVLITQECIPVGCVPHAAVAVCCGGVCRSACWDTPLGVGLETPPPSVGLETPPPVWAWRHPLGVGLETPPRPDPSTSPLGVGLETCKACKDTSTPWTPERHAGIPPAMHAGIPPPPTPSTEFLTHTSENITLPQTSFADGNKGTNELMEHHSHARTCFLHGVILLLIIFLCET